MAANQEFDCSGKWRLKSSKRDCGLSFVFGQEFHCVLFLTLTYKVHYLARKREGASKSKGKEFQCYFNYNL